jgi:hypothetical protein
MKLIMENWKRFINESEKKNYTGPPLQYSSVVLDNPQVLIDKVDELGFREQVPDDFKESLPRYPHHMTISMGGLLDGWVDDQPFTLTIDAWGLVDDGKNRAMAFRVDLPAEKKIKNKVPHITTLVPPDGKPFHSNKITEWNEITPFDVEGVVVAKQQAKKKPKPQRKQQKGQSPVEFAKGLSSRGLPADKIKDIIMKKFNKPEQAALGIMKGAGIS